MSAGILTIEISTALTKLARTLDIAESEVQFLSHLDVAALRELRWRITDELNAADAKRLAGVIAASKLVPVSLAASIGEKWFGPVLCARLVGLVEPKRGGQYAKHLSVDFMADITTRTDPRAVGDLVHELDLKAMQRIAVVLLERDDYLTLSHFVGHLPPEMVVSILAAIDDNAAVVRIARFVEDLDHLNPVVAGLSDERILALVAAVQADDLWVEGLHLFAHLGDDQIKRVAVTLVRQDAVAVVAALEAFDRHGLWDQGLHLLETLDLSDITLFADVLLDLDQELIDAVVDAIDRSDAWPTLIKLAQVADDLGESERARLREIAESLPDKQVERLTEAATDAGHPDLLERILHA